jgi:hypothetical protein
VRFAGQTGCKGDFGLLAVNSKGNRDLVHQVSDWCTSLSKRAVPACLLRDPAAEEGKAGRFLGPAARIVVNQAKLRGWKISDDLRSNAFQSV